MCVIVYKPKGSQLTKEIIQQCWKRNGDGGGYIAKSEDEEEWTMIKGIMDEEEFLRRTEKFWGANAEIVFHLRIKSKGAVCTELTHPFYFSREPAEGEDPDDVPVRLLFHNNTVKFLNEHSVLNEVNSDTSLLAKLILKPLDDENVDSLLRGLSEDGHGKFVTFNNGVISVYADSESKEIDGIWYSNVHHQNLKTVGFQQFHEREKKSQQQYGTGYFGNGYDDGDDYFRNGFLDEDYEAQADAMAAELGSNPIDDSYPFDEDEDTEPNFENPIEEKVWLSRKIAKQLLKASEAQPKDDEIREDMISTIISEEGLDIYPLVVLRQIGKYCESADPIKAWLINEKMGRILQLAEADNVKTHE